MQESFFKIKIVLEKFALNYQEGQFNGSLEQGQKTAAVLPPVPNQKIIHKHRHPQAVLTATRYIMHLIFNSMVYHV